MKYAIAWEDRYGDEHLRPVYGEFNSYAKATAKVKQLNAFYRGAHGGRYVVVEL